MGPGRGRGGGGESDLPCILALLSTSFMDSCIALEHQFHQKFWYLVAERSEAKNRDLWAGIQISASVYPYNYILRTYVRLPRSVSHASLAPGGKARVQNGASVVTRVPSSNS